MSGQQPEARAVCEHFYASRCYRGMSVRLCMTCHEPDWDDLAEQLSREPAGEPLVMPRDGYEMVKRVRRAVSESTAGSPDMESPSPAPAVPPADATGPAGGTWRERAEAAEARLLELENAVTWNTSCTSCARVLDSCAEETMRREAAEARLAVFEVHRPAVLDALRVAVADTAYGSRAGRFTAALDALDGSEEEADHG